MDYRQHLRDSGAQAYEQLYTYAGWQDQAMQLLSLDRTYIRDLARDHVWRLDKSPYREREHQQSMERTFDLAMRDRERPRQRDHALSRERPTLERTPPQQPAPVRQRLQELAATLGRDEEPQAGAALRVRLYDREEAREHDYGIGL